MKEKVYFIRIHLLARTGARRLQKSKPDNFKKMNNKVLRISCFSSENI